MFTIVIVGIIFVNHNDHHHVHDDHDHDDVNHNDHDNHDDHNHDDESYEDGNGVGANETNCTLTFVKSKQRISFAS